MSEYTKIQWCDHTFNPWIGCTKVSPGCANCYAETQDKHRKWTPDGWGKGKPRKRTSDANWAKPRAWNRAAEDAIARIKADIGNASEYNEVEYHRPRVFCASLADWLDEEAPIEWLAELLELIDATRELDWLLLTKRPEDWEDAMTTILDTWVPRSGDRCADIADEWKRGNALPNVWLGTSVEDQERADSRIQDLLDIPAHTRFLSIEPLLGPVTLSAYMGKTVGIDDKLETYNFGIDWVIIGGESGPKARPCELNWIGDLVDECDKGGAACFVKQLGSNWIGDRVFPVMNVTDPKGGNPDEWPREFRIREFP